jgi:tetratricopeptide (TPR) repeat protein
LKINYFEFLLLFTAVFAFCSEILAVESANNDLLLKADSLYSAKDYSSARDLYSSLLDYNSHTGDSLSVAICRWGMGRVAFKQRYYSKALKYFENALGDLELYQRWDELFQLHLIRGEIYAIRGLFEEAVREYRTGADIGLSADIPHYTFLGHQALGNLALLRNHYEGAQLNFELALKNAVDASDSGYAYIGFGKTQLQQDQFTPALSYIDTAENRATVAQDTMLLAEIYGVRGEIFRRSGDYITALRNYNKQLDFIKTQNDDLNRAKTMMNIALMFEMTKQYAQALDLMEEVVDIMEHLDSPDAKRAEEYLKRLRGK